MRNAALAKRELVRGAARFADLCYVITQDKALLRDDVAHVVLSGVYQGKWGDNFKAPWSSTAIAIARRPEEKAVCIGEDGDVRTYVGGKVTEERILPAPKVIRNARSIDGEVYACGMLRQMYRRVGEANWRDISAPRPKKGHTVGFESVDGFDGGEIYAVGWEGELWQYDGTRWTQHPTPTNVILSAVCCAGDGVVYVAGYGGVMLRGRGDQWELIDWEEGVTAQLWDVCWFDGKLYVAAINHLYTLAGPKLVPVDFGDSEPGTCFSLSSAGGVLWSVGRDDVVSFDGTSWQRYT